jgi:DnaJ like chaperone protein
MIGKILGAYFGYSLTHAAGLGFWGVVLGLWLGSRFDRGYAKVNQSGSYFFSMNHSRVQKTFFDSSFAVMGHIAKLDGVVSENEIKVAQDFMRQLNMNMAAKKEAKIAFNRGKSPAFDLQKELGSLLQTCGGQTVLLRLFIDIQHKAAAADGLSEIKIKLLNQINARLGFSRSYNYQGSNQYAGSQNAGSQSGRSNLEQAYADLGMSTSNSDSEVKLAYRKLMSKNHPDKLISQGLPKEMIKIANEKTAAIQAAYATIKKHRGLS